ncbi:MAG TPA: hypothetical protein HA289_07630 [Ferroplasma sp.]|jgi:hypothetical protein|nr:hypothetical protein [Ferroplasma sp.]
MKETAIRREYRFFSLNRNRKPEMPATITKKNDRKLEITNLEFLILRLSRTIINETTSIRNPSIIWNITTM